MSLGNDVKNEMADGRFEKTNNHDKIANISGINGITETDSIYIHSGNFSSEFRLISEVFLMLLCF